MGLNGRAEPGGRRVGPWRGGAWMEEKGVWPERGRSREKVIEV